MGEAANRGAASYAIRSRGPGEGRRRDRIGSKRYAILSRASVCSLTLKINVFVNRQALCGLRSKAGEDSMGVLLW